MHLTYNCVHLPPMVHAAQLNGLRIACSTQPHHLRPPITIRKLYIILHRATPCDQSVNLPTILPEYATDESPPALVPLWAEMKLKS